MKYICNESNCFSEEEKKAIIDEAAKHYKEFMHALKIDVDNDPNSEGTPLRVAKMFVNELCKGRYIEKPLVQSFPNTQE